MLAVPGGGRGIRTPGDITATVVFKTTAFVLSAIPPGQDLPAIDRNSINPMQKTCQIKRASPRPEEELFLPASGPAARNSGSIGNCLAMEAIWQP